MFKAIRRKYNWYCGFADIILIGIIFWGTYYLRDNILRPAFPDIFRDSLISPFIYMPIFILVLFVGIISYFAVGVYRIHPAGSRAIIAFRLLYGHLLTALFTLALAYGFRLYFLSRTFLFLYLFLLYLSSLIVRLLLRSLILLLSRRGKMAQKVLLVGTSEKARKVAKYINDYQDWGIHLEGFITTDPVPDEKEIAMMKSLGIPCLGANKDLAHLLEGRVVDGVVFVVEGKNISELEDMFLICEDLGISAYLSASFFPHLIARLHLESLDELPFIQFSTIPTKPFHLMAKRFIDLIGSSICLVLTSPFFLIATILIKVTSKGPVFFKQERVGLNGRRFILLKFRSMVADAEKIKPLLESANEATGPVFKIRNDPRITKLGKLLRKTSVDELPQLINVLKGNMSLVGPRPPVPLEVEKYQRWQRRRLSMRPGITCLWQVSGRSEIGFEEWMRLDLKYIDSWSLALDFIILLKTIPAVLSTRGAA